MVSRHYQIIPGWRAGAKPPGDEQPRASPATWRNNVRTPVLPHPGVGARGRPLPPSHPLCRCQHSKSSLGPLFTCHLPRSPEGVPEAPEMTTCCACGEHNAEGPPGSSLLALVFIAIHFCVMLGVDLCPLPPPIHVETLTTRTSENHLIWR